MTKDLKTRWLDNQNDITKSILTPYVMKQSFTSKLGIFLYIEDTESGLYFVYFKDSEAIVATYDSEDESYSFMDTSVRLNLSQMYDLLDTVKDTTKLN